MTWDAHNLASAHSEQKPEPTHSRIAYPGSRVLVSGEPESLKSWLAAVAAAERIRERESVCWIDFEQGPAMTRTGVPARELAERAGHARPSMSLDVYSHVMPPDELASERFLALIGKEAPH